MRTYTFFNSKVEVCVSYNFLAVLNSSIAAYTGIRLFLGHKMVENRELSGKCCPYTCSLPAPGRSKVMESCEKPYLELIVMGLEDVT